MSFGMQRAKPRGVTDSPSANPAARVLNPAGLHPSIASRYGGGSTCVSTQVGTLAENAKKLNLGRVGTRATDYKTGDIVHGPFLEPNLNGAKFTDDPDIAWTRATGFINGKMRPYVVIGIHPHRGLLVVPVYSSQGRGVVGMPEQARADILHLLNPRDPEPSVPGIPRGHVVYTDPRDIDPRDPWTAKEGSYIPASQCLVLKFQFPLTKRAALDAKSTAKLQTIFSRLVAESFGNAARTAAPALHQYKDAPPPTRTAWAASNAVRR